MNEIELFEQTYNEVIEELTLRIKDNIKTKRKNEVEFTKVFNETNEALRQEYEKHITDLNLNDAFKFFNEKLKDYRGELDNKRNSVLTKEMETYFKNNLKNTDYEAFIKNIAKAKALIRSKNNFSQSYTIFILMYELNNFREFALINFSHEKPDIITKLRKKLYPEEFNASVIKNKKDYTQQIEETNNYLKNFNDREKSLLLKAFYGLIHTKVKNSNSKSMKDVIPATEFAKLTMIISNFEKPDVFYKSSKDANISKKISPEYTKPEKEVLNKLLPKLEKHKLKQIKEYIISINTR